MSHPSLFPRLLVSRPGHPVADGAGMVSVYVEREAGEVRAYPSGFGRMWLAASELVEAERLLSEREAWMRECETRSDARRGGDATA